jgi:hypothetical protein
MQHAKSTRSTFFRNSLEATVGMTVVPAALEAAVGRSGVQPKLNAEWRNRQSGMSYRMFGSTGMMVSEIVQGTALWTEEDHVRVFEAAVEHGVNYIDASPAYEKGVSEKLVGQYLKKPGKRERLFVSNKISFYDEYMTRLSNEIFNGLPGEKKSCLKENARKMMAERDIMRPDYHFTYFKNQESKFEKAYLRYLVNQVAVSTKTGPRNALV